MSIQTKEGHTFHGTGDAGKQQSLFAVAPGIPTHDALRSVSVLLASIEGEIFAAAMDERPLHGNIAWMVRNTLEAAHAVVDSLISAAEDAEDAEIAKEPGRRGGVLRSLPALLTELGDCQLAQFVAMADYPFQAKQGRESAADWAFGYLTALKDLGRITAAEYEALASEPRRLALQSSHRE